MHSQVGVKRNFINLKPFSCLARLGDFSTSRWPFWGSYPYHQVALISNMLDPVLWGTWRKVKINGKFWDLLRAEIGNVVYYFLLMLDITVFGQNSVIWSYWMQETRIYIILCLDKGRSMVKTHCCLYDRLQARWLELRVTDSDLQERTTAREQQPFPAFVLSSWSLSSCRSHYKALGSFQSFS